MKLFLTPADYILWIAAFSVAVLLFTACIYRKQYRRYPVFVTYVGFCILKTVVLAVAAHRSPYSTYFYFYWAGAILRMMLLLGIVIEVFNDIFLPLETVPPGKISRLSWMIVAVVFLAITMAYFLPARSDYPMTAYFRTIDRTATFIIVSVMWLVIFESDRIGIPKTARVYGICTGGIFFLMLTAGISTVQWAYALKEIHFLRYLDMGGFTISEIIWLWYLQKPVPVVQPVNKEQLLHLQGLLEVFTKLSFKKTNSKRNILRLTHMNQ